MVRYGSVVAVVGLWAGAAAAGTINAMVNTEAGAPVANAVVYAVPASGALPAPKAAQMAQENQEFIPYVLPVQVGATVDFPNRDSFRHHVYSFSAPKPFELKLFSGTERQMVTFDKPGAIALGCNIHDNMLAYIYAVPTPYFAVTGEDGKAALSVPAGVYAVKTWQPNQRGTGDNAVEMTVRDAAADYKAVVTLKPERKGKKPGAKDETEY
jgi:plastocyanin